MTAEYVNKGYRMRLYPTRKQQIDIDIFVEQTRIVYNNTLQLQEDVARRFGWVLGQNELSKALTGWKRAIPALTYCDAVALQDTQADFLKAMANWRAGHIKKPRLKSAKGSLSYTTKQQTSMRNIMVDMENQTITLPKLGQVPACVTRPIDRTVIKRARIIRDKEGVYWCSVTTKEELSEPFQKTGKEVGIDWGIATTLTFSDGQKLNPLNELDNYTHRVYMENRKLKRREKQAREKGISLIEAKNYQKQLKKTEKMKKRLQYKRRDILHKLSLELVKEYDVIAVEDLDLKELSESKSVLKTQTLNSCYGMFVDMLEYKCHWYGKELVKVGRYYPSSQICNACGRQDGKKDLRIRCWTCPECHAELDRDVNAALNILQEGRRILKETIE